MSLSRIASDANWDGAATLVRAGLVAVGSIYLHNENAATRYVQLFNSATVAGVTLGTTEPVMNIPVTTDGTFRHTFERPAQFDLGLVVAATTATRGATTGGTLNYTVEIA